MSDRLSEIEARLAAATPGPWENDGGGEIGQHYSRPEPYQQIVSTTVSCGSYCLGGSSAGVEHHDDAELIAHAPADLAALVAFARSIETANDRYMKGSIGPVSLSIDVHAALQKLGGAS